MNQIFPELLTSKITTLVEEHWPHIKKPEDSALVWQYCLSDPLPVYWPMPDQHLAFYVYARALDMRQPTAGEIIAEAWAKIITRGDAIEQWVSLQSEVIPEQHKGLRPLTASELHILNINPIDLLCAPISTENHSAIKSFYQLQLTLGNIPRAAIAHHSDFFNWLDESQQDKT